MYILNKYINNNKPPLGCKIDYSNSLTSGLLNYWVCNEKSGNILTDLVKSNNSKNIGITYGNGYPYFDGTTSLSTPRQAVTLPGAFTIMFWYITNEANNTARMLFGNADNSRKIGKGATGNNLFVRLIGAGSSDNVIAMPATNKWHQIVIRRDTSNIANLIIDGNNRYTLFSGAAQVGVYAFDAFGYVPAVGQYWLGGVDSIYVYNRYLQNQEIEQLYYNKYSFILTPKRRKYFLPLSSTTNDMWTIWSMS